MMDFNPIEFPMNGFTTYVMNSDQLVDQVVQDFESYIAEGVEPQRALNYSLININEDDLTSSDKNRIQRKIEAIAGTGLRFDQYY